MRGGDLDDFVLESGVPSALSRKGTAKMQRALILPVYKIVPHTTANMTNPLKIPAFVEHLNQLAEQVFHRLWPDVPLSDQFERQIDFISLFVTHNMIYNRYSEQVNTLLARERNLRNASLLDDERFSNPNNVLYRLPEDVKHGILKEYL